MTRIISSIFNKMDNLIWERTAFEKVNKRWNNPPVERVRHKLGCNLIVSLTSHHPRFKTLHYTLKTLLSQDIEVNAVLLWISYGEYKHLPNEVKELEKFGLEVRERQDLKVYNKFMHTLREHPSDIFVVCDDDTYYPSDWLRKLVEAKRPSGQLIPCHRVHRIKMLGEKPLPYNLWDQDVKVAQNHALVFPTGVGGILLSKGLLHPLASEAELALEVCPRADDIWLYWMARLAGSIYQKIEGHHRFRSWHGSQEVALWRSNNAGEMGNDLRIDAMIQKFGSEVFRGTEALE